MSGAAGRGPSKWSDLGVRSLSAVVLIPAVLLDVWLGGVWFRLLVGLIAVLMAYEWTALAHDGSSAQFALHAAAALSGAFLPGEAGPAASLIAVVALATVSVVLVQFQLHERNAWTSLGVFYVGLSAAALVQLGADHEFGFHAIIWILVIVWAADSAAYFSGRTIGGPKLAPVISPNKTWAGFLGAMAGAALAASIYSAVADIGSPGWLALVGAALAVFEQGGDLFKSAFKRHYGVKDTGHLIPGHGGVIDRVDGLVAVSMVAALIGLARAGADATGRGLLIW